MRRYQHETSSPRHAHRRSHPSRAARGTTAPGVPARSDRHHVRTLRHHRGVCRRRAQPARSDGNAARHRVPRHFRCRLSAGDGRGVPAPAQVQARHGRGRAHLGAGGVGVCRAWRHAYGRSGGAPQSAGIRGAAAVPARGDDLHQHHGGTPGVQRPACLAGVARPVSAGGVLVHRCPDLFHLPHRRQLDHGPVDGRRSHGGSRRQPPFHDAGLHQCGRGRQRGWCLQPVRRYYDPHGLAEGRSAFPAVLCAVHSVHRELVGPGPAHVVRIARRKAGTGGAAGHNPPGRPGHHRAVSADYHPGGRLLQLPASSPGGRHDDRTRPAEVLRLLPRAHRRARARRGGHVQRSRQRRGYDAALRTSSTACSGRSGTP